MSIHYNIGIRPPQVTKAQLAAWLDQAMRAHQEGALAQANQLYNTILKNDPKNVGALHMQGVLAYQAGHLQMAVDLIGQAIKLVPDDAAPHVNRGLALSALKRHDEALAHFERATSLRPDFAEAYVNRGITLKELSRPLDAIESYNQAIALQPRLSAAYNNKGNALRQLDRLDEAQKCYEQAFARNNQDVDACQNLGVLHADAGRLDEALRYFDHAISLRPQHAEAHNCKGAILAQREQWIQAIKHFETATKANDKLVQAYKNLGLAQRCLFQYANAVQAFQKAAQLSPQDVDILSLCALSLLDAGRYSEGLALYDQAIRLAPDMLELIYNRAGLHIRFNRHEDAIADYLAAYRLKPDVKYLLGHLVNSRLKTCDWRHLPADLDQCQHSIRAGELGIQPFIALSLFDSPELHKQAAQTSVKLEFPESTALGAIPPRAGGGKIRIGYYSADFYNHATAFLMAELFEAHDHDRFEWFAFSFGPPANDAMRERLSTSFDHFIDVRELGGIDIARMSRELGIDIAVDLKGFTQDNRFRIFAHRCAPVQVSYLGYPGTTGASYMDYMIADKVVIPAEAQIHFTEKVVYLPHSYQVNDSKRTISDRVFTREEVGLPATGFVFCCFNNNYKILPQVFDGWMRILQAVPGSVLWLFEDNPAVVGNLRREAMARGVASERLVFAQRLPLDQHLARHRLADLFLDTLPVNAHTTASDALWAGLPVLTRLGESFAARVAASLLHAVGLPELVTQSTAEYEALAITLAQDPARLQALRDKLIAQKPQSPLFNARQFARDIEAAYVAMHERHQQGLPPEVIEV
jgi:protein O-GlcNAc transferase